MKNDVLTLQASNDERGTFNCYPSTLRWSGVKKGDGRMHTDIICKSETTNLCLRKQELKSKRKSLAKRGEENELIQFVGNRKRRRQQCLFRERQLLSSLDAYESSLQFLLKANQATKRAQSEHRAPIGGSFHHEGTSSSGQRLSSNV